MALILYSFNFSPSQPGNTSEIESVLLRAESFPWAEEFVTETRPAFPACLSDTASTKRKDIGTWQFQAISVLFSAFLHTLRGLTK